MNLLEKVYTDLERAADAAGEDGGILRSPEAQADYFVQRAQVLAMLRLAQVIGDAGCSCDQEEDSYDTVHPLFVVPAEVAEAVTVEVREDGVSVIEDPAPVEVTTVEETPEPVATPDVNALTDVLEKVITEREENPPQSAPYIPRIGPPASAPNSYLSRNRENHDSD